MVFAFLIIVRKCSELIKNNKLFPAYWILLSFLALAGDYITGPFLRFPILFIVPVALASWHNGARFGYILAICLSLIRLYFDTIWEIPWTLFETSINALIRIVVFCILAFLVDQKAKQKRALEKEIKVLRGILPICSFCKKIRNQNNSWEQIEKYITEHSESAFSHGICPDCARKQYGIDVSDEKNSRGVKY